MRSVTIRELRNRGGDVIERVAAGEPLLVTRDGRPVAELHPLRRLPVDTAGLVARRRTLPPIDPAALRADLDALIDQRL